MVHLQHGTGVEGSWQPCTKGHNSKKGFSRFERIHVSLQYVVQYYFNAVYFSPLQVKNKQNDGVTNMRLFLSLLALLQML